MLNLAATNSKKKKSQCILLMRILFLFFPEFHNPKVRAACCTQIIMVSSCSCIYFHDCSWFSSLLQECTLCFLRGGALKTTTDGQWCHIVCALSLPDVSFQDINSRGPVDITKISQKRARLVIIFCIVFL